MTLNYAVDEIYLTFVIQGFGTDPDELTHTLGVEPTSAHKKGDMVKMGNAEIIARENIWQLKSPLDSTATAEEQLDDMLKKLLPSKSKIVEATKEMDVVFSFGIYFKDAQPGMHFTNDQLKQVADLNAGIDLDLYFLPVST